VNLHTRSQCLRACLLMPKKSHVHNTVITTNANSKSMIPVPVPMYISPQNLPQPYSVPPAGDPPERWSPRATPGGSGGGLR